MFALDHPLLYLSLDVDFSKARTTSNQLLCENLFRSPERNIFNLLLAASCVNTCFERSVKTADAGPFYVWKRTKQPASDCLSFSLHSICCEKSQNSNITLTLTAAVNVPLRASSNLLTVVIMQIHSLSYWPSTLIKLTVDI